MYQKRTFVTMEALRGIAAICVMLNHYTGANLFPNPIAPDFFWCLSGFVIASSYEQKLEGGMPVREFLRRRLIRVYPMYILGTFVGLLAIIMMFRAEPLHPRFGSIALATISSILILPYLLPFSVPFAGHVVSWFTFPLNPPAWSLIFELGANGLYSVLRPKSRLWFVAAIAISYYLTVTSTVAFSAPGGPDFFNIFGGIFRAIFSFFAGVLLWEVWNSKDAKIIQFDLGPLPACLALLVICSIPYSKIEFLVLILSIVPLTVWLATSNPRSAAASALFRVLGKVAYPIYSIHWPAYQVAQLSKGVIRGIPPNSPLSYASSLVLAAAVILVAYLLVIFYDQPLRRRLSEFRWLDWPTSVVN